MVESAVKSVCTKHGLEQVLTDNSGSYFFKVPLSQSKSQILEGGPWLFFSKAMILQQWTPDLILCKEHHQKIFI